MTVLMAFQDDGKGGKDTKTGARGLEMALETPITGMVPSIERVKMVL